MDMRALGGGDYSSARGINDTGQVVGNSGGTHVFITGPNGMGMRDIGVGDVHTGTVISFASGINDAGQVVGYTLTPVDETLAFITGPDGMGVRNLGNTRHVAASGVNDAGQVVGSFWSRGMGGDPTLGARHAFITGPDGMDMRDLGTLGGTYSYAEGISDTGQVVGYSYTTGGAQHAFITDPDGTNMRDLGTLGGSFSFANGINDAGQVVGYSYTTGGAQHAFITGPDGVGMMDLNSLVDLPTGWILTSAIDINNNGQVIAVGIVPEPETYALMLAGLGLMGIMVSRKKAENSRMNMGSTLTA